MIEIAYTSRASEMMTEDQLSQLLKEAVEFNLAHDVTGLLLYNEGVFFQIIEGDETTVKNLYTCIQQDFRHYDVRQIYQQPLTERHFQGWSMSFHNVSPDVRQQGHSPTITTTLDETEQWILPSTAKVLVDAFRNL